MLRLVGRRVFGMRVNESRSAMGRILWFAGCVYVFLPVPDLDILLVPVLHHRSIITHSILPALLFLAVERHHGAAPVLGAMVGLAVHLSTDALSPPIGFGAVWLPEPVQVSLGPLSPIWLAGNAVIGFWIAPDLSRRALDPRFGPLLTGLMSVITAILCVWLNEKAFAALGIALALFAAACALAWAGLKIIPLADTGQTKRGSHIPDT